MARRGVPARALEVQTVHIASRRGRSHICGRACYGGLDMRQHLEIETDLVDRKLVLTGEVLESASQKRLSEEETGDPAHKKNNRERRKSKLATGQQANVHYDALQMCVCLF